MSISSISRIAPAFLHQLVVGSVYIFRQRQASCGIVIFGFSASARICSASCYPRNRRKKVQRLRGLGLHGPQRQRDVVHQAVGGIVVVHFIRRELVIQINLESLHLFF